ncbi:MAG TPA: type II secretion system protein N [Casimicrobiaceae bacterium]|nr:type II secretion system protein N [Casimicrobiaceae bacterium]
MKLAAFLVAALACLLAAVAAFMPATLVDLRLDAASGGKLRLTDATGTVWDGRGAVTDAGGAWRVPVAWSISKADVLRNVHAVALRPVDDAATPRGTVQAVDDGARVHDLSVEVPAQALAALLPTRALPVLGGTIAVSAADFAWTAKDKSGRVEAQWRGARLVSGDARADLGTVTLSAAPQGSALGGRIANTGGDVRLDATVAVSDGSVSVEGTIAPAAGAPPTIARALAAFGTPDAAGAVRVAWRGSLR